MGRVKKIILTVTNDLNFDQRMIKISTTLAHNGYEVLLVGRKRKSSKALKEQPFQQKRIHCIFEKGKFFYLEYNLRLFFFLLFQKADILCAIDLDTILPNLWVSKIKNSHLVYDAHEYFTEVPELLDRKFTKKIWENIEAYALKHVKNAYTVGPEIARLFQEKYGLKFEVIMNAPRIKTIYKLEREYGVLLYQGALNKGRGIENYIDMMTDLDAHLWIIGEGDLSKELRERAEQLNLNHKITFWGFVDPVELPNFTRKAYIGLNVSENLGLSYYYSLNNKCFDHIHALLPTVTNPFPEYMAINNRWETMVFANANSTEIKNAVQRLLQNPVYYYKLAANCEEARAVLCWENEERKLLKFYERFK